MNKPQGPNVRRLITVKMSYIMIPPGTTNGLATGLEALSSKDRIMAAAREATTWVEQAIAVVKTSTDNPFGDDDEAIAGEILLRLDDRSKPSKTKSKQ